MVDGTIPQGYNADGTLKVEKIEWWQVQMLDDEATARRGYQVYRVLAELDWYHADYERQVLQQAGHCSRIVPVKG